MIKTGRVEIGKTPSAASGRPSTRVEDGEPVSDKDGKQKVKSASLKKLVREFDNLADRLQ